MDEAAARKVVDRVKVARTEVTLFAVECPHCSKQIPAESGSFHWDYWREEDIQPGPRRCPECRKEFKLPEVVTSKLE